MHRFIFILGLLLVSTLFADNEPNNNCSQVETVQALDGSSPTISATISGTANQNTDRYDYYQFTVGESGTLDFYYDADKAYSSLFIGSTCDGSQYYSNTSNTSSKDPQPFNVQAGDTIYIKIERRYPTNMDYDLDVDFIPPQFSGTNFKDFDILYTENLRGDIKMIGNTILGEWAVEWYWNGWGWKSRYVDDTTCPGDTTNNSWFASRFWDVDNDASTFNSSSSFLDIPAGSTIKKAYLYWQGRASSNWYNSTKSIKLRPPGASAYTTLTAPDNNVYWATYGNLYPYQASVEVTDLINGPGTYTVGDLTTYAGSATDGDDYYPDGLGAYGAWSLVVVYENENENLQNVTIYDGYQNISNSNVQDFTLSGFLTPQNGDVNSKFLIFTGEGDVDLLGDYAKMDDVRLTRFNDNSTNTSNYNTFNASITNNGAYVTSRNPSCQNNFGIDIHTYNVGTDGLGIIGNDQTSAELEIGTNGDWYYLSVFAFATQLYEPRVCYFIDTIRDKDSNETVFENKSFVSGTEIDPDKEYAFDIWISNMKKSGDTGTIETAELVQIYMDMTDIDYYENSTLMKNLGDSSFTTRNDLFDFEPGSDHNGTSTYRVGDGASSVKGGTIEPAANFNDDSKKAFIKFDGKFIINDENATSLNLVEFFDFSAAFKVYDIEITKDNAIKISQCEDLNTSANIIRPPKGAFDVVNSTFSGNSLNSESDTALFTQVAGQSFDVQVVALDSDFTTLRNHTGDVSVSVIDMPAYSGDPSNDQTACDNASPINSQTIGFNNEKSKSVTFSLGNVYRNLSFKVSYEENGNTINVCATDNFAVRPASYKFEFNPTPLIGGKLHRITTTALANDGSSITNQYDGNAEQNLTLIKPLTCLIADDNATAIIGFSNGDNETDVKTGNIGDYNLSVIDKTWTDVDKGHSYGHDCNYNDSTNTHDASGKVGCDISKVQTIIFSPKDFNIAPNINNFNDGNFTYISNDDTMSATIDFGVTARLEDNNTATAYDGLCYAKDINSTIEMRTATPHGWGTNDSTAINRIRYFDDGNITTTFEQNATVGEVTLSSTEGNFTAGTANLTALFNFDRNISIPDMPFIISKNDFNITVIDENGTTGADFNRTNDENSTFYYGRVFAPDQPGQRSPINNVRIYYEVFCGGCTTNDFNITGSAGVEDTRWNQNIHHDDIGQGQVYIFDSVGSTQFSKPANAAQVNTLATAAGEITDGIQLINLHEVNDKTDHITMDPDDWLLFNRFDPTANTNDFWVNFTSNSGWAGEGTVKRSGVIDGNATGAHTQNTSDDDNLTLKRSNRRMNW